MRGRFFQQPLEYGLEVEGERWQQSDSLSCTLSVKNHDSQAQSLSALFLYLARGSLKKVQQKADDAFEIVATAQCAFAPEVQAGSEESFNWTFALDKNCPITDKSHSLYLLCGKGEVTEAAGALQLPVEPHSFFQALHTSLENTFSFVLKGLKYKNGLVEAKLKPPAGTRFPTLEHLLLYSGFDGDDLVLKYCFKTKGLGAGSADSFEIRKGKKELEQKLNPDQYLMPGGFIDYDGLEASVKEALELVETKI